MSQPKPTLENCASDPAKLNEYLSMKAWAHHYFKTYSTLNRIESWMDLDCLFLDDGRRWNDKYDREMFNNDRSEEMRFGRCFSFSHKENVAMWMLYGGMNKNGAMLEFSNAAMHKLIRNVHTVDLGNWENNEFVVIRTLNEGEFRLELKDILYRDPDKEQSDTVFIRRSDERYTDAPKSSVNQLEHCVKVDAWHYENECRLMLSVNKTAVPEAAQASSVKIPLNGLFKDSERVKIYCSPVFEGTHEYLKSKLTGSIDWDLCSGCPRPIPENA